MQKDQVECIMDLGSSKFRFSVINKDLAREIINKEKKIFSDVQIDKSKPAQVFDEIIKNSEKDIGLHIKNINIIADNKNLFSIDLSIKKSFEGKNISQGDFEFLEMEAKKIIEENYNDYIVIHSVVQKFFIDDKEYDSFQFKYTKFKYLSLTIKFLCYPKKAYQNIISLLNNNHIELKSFGCSSFVKSKSYNFQFPEYEYKFFLDIGYEKTILSIYKNDILKNFNIIKIGGLNITKDISKILKIEIFDAEKLKIKMHETEVTFSDQTDYKFTSEEDLVKKIIFARVEEIFNLSFQNINFFEDIKKVKSILIFTGEGSKILENNSIYLNKLFESFDDIHYLEETSSKICMASHKFSAKEKLKNSSKPINVQEKTGFFEKFFNLFSKI